MNIELEDLLKFIKEENDTRTLTIDEAYTIFFSYLKEFRRIETYNYHLTYYKTTKQFFDIYKIEYTNQINNEVILNFVKYCKFRNNKNTTINKKVSSIKYMLNFLNKKGLISKHKINYDKLPNDEERFKIIEANTIKKITEYCMNNINEYKLIIMILLTTGIRRTELCKIKLSDINIKNSIISLSHTKSGKPRNIFIIEPLIEPIKHQMKNNNIYLFENQFHTSHINPDNLVNVFRKIKKDLNIENLSPHMFRHTYATTLLEKGADLESIRLLLGHCDYSMIMRYVHIKEKKLAEISTSFNPYNN